MMNHDNTPPTCPITRRPPPRIAHATIAVAACTLAACHGGPPASPPRPQAAAEIANLHAFARLYGVVRWFHPSDAAAAVDWDRFAREGVHRVVDAPDASTLRDRLRALFGSMAPTVQVVIAGEAFQARSSPAGDEQVYWQHRGFGDTLLNAGYASKRRHRPAEVPAPGDLAAPLVQTMDATPFRGARLRLRGKLRAHKGRAQLWMRVDREHTTGFFDNMEERPVTSERWTTAEVIGTVDLDARQIAFGTLTWGTGTAWYDDLELAVEGPGGSWTPVSIADAGLEDPEPLRTWPPGIGYGPPDPAPDGWRITTDRENPAAGVAALRVEPVMQALAEDDLFPHTPAIGEFADLELGSGVRARVPISLASQSGHTLGDDPAAARASQAKPEAPHDRFDALTGAADVLVVWNAFQHFWPYWHSVEAPWGAALDRALAEALADRNPDDLVATLERLTVGAPDGHVSVGCSGSHPPGHLPFAVDLVEGNIVVTVSADPAVRPGDVLMELDGRPATSWLRRAEAQLSGSPQWRLRGALRALGSGPAGSTVSIHLRRGTAAHVASVVRGDRAIRVPLSGPPIERMPDGIYYIDLSRASMTDLEPILDQLARAPGVVLDARGRPRGNHDILSHLTTRLDHQLSWEAIPGVLRPDSASSPAAWLDHTADNMPQITVAQPHITGRVAFLTGPGAISYAESFMAYVAHYHLGEIVGAATAGTNGDIAMIGTPSGCTVIFTGRRVTMPDGSPFHLQGIKPTIPVARTIAGVRDRRDEVLEAGLRYVRGAGSSPVSRGPR